MKPLGRDQQEAIDDRAEEIAAVKEVLAARFRLAQIGVTPLPRGVKGPRVPRDFVVRDKTR